MPRSGRLILPGHPHHVMQQGFRGQTVFHTDGDFRKYLRDMRELREELGVRIYAWCLLSNQVHLLLDPGPDPEALPEFMKALSLRTTRHRNRRRQQNGSLWEGRYRSSPVQTGYWFLAAVRGIELQAVMLGEAVHVASYRWSSYRERMGRAEPYCLDPHADYLALGRTDEERRESYRLLMRQGQSEQEWRHIELALRRSQPIGDDMFTQSAISKASKTVTSRNRTRPRNRKS